VCQKILLRRRRLAVRVWIVYKRSWNLADLRIQIQIRIPVLRGLGLGREMATGLRISASVKDLVEEDLMI
jgi:hypothetical protein